LGSKIELFIWNAGSSEPATPTYTLSKPIPTTAQRLTSYNVSNFVKEYIENIAPTYVNYYGAGEDSNQWCIFRVKRYYLNSSSVYVLLTDQYYYAINGFTNYMDGIQIPEETKMSLLTNTNINKTYYSQDTYPNDLIQYVNLIIDKTTTNTTIVNIKYERIDGVAYNNNDNFAVGYAGIFFIKLPISLVKLDSNFINGCKVTVTYTPATGSPIIKSFFTYPVCEPKYTPVLCDFINRYGGWETITFFKAQTNNITAKSDDYKLMPKEVDYNVFRGQSKSFNFNGSQNVTLNTGWVDENYSELITDLLLSETVLLDQKPVNLKTQSSELKTKLKNRMINYTMEFEYNFNLINDVV
jgi:hypothetical protein